MWTKSPTWLKPTKKKTGIVLASHIQQRGCQYKKCKRNQKVLHPCLSKYQFVVSKPHTLKTAGAQCKYLNLIFGLWHRIGSKRPVTGSTCCQVPKMENFLHFYLFFLFHKGQYTRMWPMFSVLIFFWQPSQVTCCICVVFSAARIIIIIIHIIYLHNCVVPHWCQMSSALLPFQAKSLQQCFCCCCCNHLLLQLVNRLQIKFFLLCFLLKVLEIPFFCHDHHNSHLILINSPKGKSLKKPMF